MILQRVGWVRFTLVLPLVPFVVLGNTVWAVVRPILFDGLTSVPRSLHKSLATDIYMLRRIFVTQFCGSDLIGLKEEADMHERWLVAMNARRPQGQAVAEKQKK